MQSHTYISISQKNLSLKPLLRSPRSPAALRRHHLLLSSHYLRWLIPFLLFWALLTISQLRLPLPISCSPHLNLHLHHVSLSLRARRGPPPSAEFWKWAHSDSPRVVPCLHSSEPRRRPPVVSSGKYMVVVVSGGLNQQRNQIIDAVVVARILEAVLVLPVFQVNQVWGDESEFGDIFDVEHFKKTLKDEVVVVSSLPATHLRARRVKAPPMPFNAEEEWIRGNYSTKLGRETILVLRAFDSRLAKNLSVDLQKLRCKVAFEALRFKPWIKAMADKFIERMEEEGQPFMALHLRLEKDVWVRTGCHSGLGLQADLIIQEERSSKPQLLTSRTKLTPQQRYLAGLCPLNAHEISRLLRGLGAPKNVRIYWAGGEPFGGEKALEPLKTQYPSLFNKWDLAQPGELDGIRNKPSIMAALDYIVCLKSDVFLASHGGNMARSLQGHRTFIGSGKQIKPKKKLLVQLFQINKTLTETEIGNKIKKTHMHRESMDLSVMEAQTKRDVIAFPVPYCMCSKGGNRY
ncbi:hypothetical protein Cni_G29038 [Canna indica]|uniref:O-fucosyltransferase family protein n=1 Tax=Canna indica TaxID=4628 RepID=A0AAQ3QQV5_9LILI|nr:hypothetical protein Cni_G29038 [Canna indica]